jgi:hypothetical protein
MVTVFTGHEFSDRTVTLLSLGPGQQSSKLLTLCFLTVLVISAKIFRWSQHYLKKSGIKSGHFERRFYLHAANGSDYINGIMHASFDTFK